MRAKNHKPQYLHFLQTVCPVLCCCTRTLIGSQLAASHSMLQMQKNSLLRNDKFIQKQCSQRARGVFSNFEVDRLIERHYGQKFNFESKYLFLIAGQPNI